MNRVGRALRRLVGSCSRHPRLTIVLAIGALGLTRETPGAFTERQIALAQTFADQAVIALRNANFFREIQERNAELKKSLEFQGATGEILASLSSSVTDTKPVFDAIVRSVLRLFGTQFTAVFLLRNDMLELAALKGHPDFEKRFVNAFPQPLNDSTLTGKVLRTGKLMQATPLIGNPASVPETERLAREFDFNSMMIAPMCTTARMTPPSTRRITTSVASHRRAARSATASSTGCISVGEDEITPRMSAVAVWRSSASFVSLNSRAFSIAITA